MIIYRFVSDLLLSNMYLLEEGGHALVIDPCRNIEPGEGLQIDKVLLTHEHYDHISGVNVWKKAYHARVLCSEACAKNIANPKKNMVRYFDAFCEMQNWVKLDEMPDVDLQYICTAEETFADETTFKWQGHTIRMFELPGHSQGSTGILVDNCEFFSGDSFMKHGPVELRFPGGSAKEWKKISVPRIAMLPDGLRIYPGHFEEFIFRRGG